MKAKEYIINGLNVLVDKFQNLSFKYKYDKTDDTHIISVEPLKEFAENKDYLIAESDFVYYFEKKFIEDNILFVSENSLIKIDNPEFVFKSNERSFLMKEQFPETAYKYNFEMVKTKEEIEEENSHYSLAA